MTPQEHACKVLPLLLSLVRLSLKALAADLHALELVHRRRMLPQRAVACALRRFVRAYFLLFTPLMSVSARRVRCDGHRRVPHHCARRRRPPRRARVRPPPRRRRTCAWGRGGQGGVHRWLAQQQRHQHRVCGSIPSARYRRLTSSSRSTIRVRPTAVQQLIRAGFFGVQFTVAYLLMLLAMYYNGFVIMVSHDYFSFEWRYS
jgi:hypothetical protein